MDRIGSVLFWAGLLLYMAMLAACAPHPEIIAGPLVDSASQRWHAAPRPSRVPEVLPSAEPIDKRIDALEEDVRALRDRLRREP